MNATAAKGKGGKDAGKEDSTDPPEPNLTVSLNCCVSGPCIHDPCVPIVTLVPMCSHSDSGPHVFP